jgi:glycosyltransferase involved in cell wall biosynthesis
MSHSRSRILVLTSTFPRWQGDHEPPFVYELSRRLAHTHEVYILAPHAPDLAVCEEMAGMQIRRFRYFFNAYEQLAYQGGILAKLKAHKSYYFLVPFFLIGQWWALLKLLRQQRFDIIHAHWIFPQALIALLARLCVTQKPAILCTSHGGDLFALRGTLWRWVKTWVLNKVDAISVVSTPMREALAALAVNLDKVAVIPMGVDLHHLFVPPPQAPITPQVLFVGRLVAKKGVSYLLDAFAAISTEFPQLSLKIVGDGPLRASLHAQAQSLGIAARTEFCPPRPNHELPQIYHQASLVVFPSVIADNGDQEGFGLVLVEALGCACATITTDLPAMRDIIRDRESTLVVAQKDAHALAAAMRILLRDEDLRLHLGQCGRQAVLSRYDWEIIVARYHTLLTRCLS